MARAKTKWLIAGIALIAAVGYLAFAGAKSGWVYYVDVDQLLSDPQYQNRPVRVCGRVDEKNYDASPARLDASFVLLGNQHILAVKYHGILPDTFKAGCDAVIEGILQPDGSFLADNVLTKCASKYQAEEHTKKLTTRPAGEE